MTEAVVLDGTRVRELCESDATLGYELIRRVAAVSIHRLQAAQLRLMDLYDAPTR